MLSIDTALGIVLEEIPQGREDPLYPVFSERVKIGSMPLAELWPAMINSKHDSQIIGALSITPLHAAILCGVDTGSDRLTAYALAGAAIDIPADDGTTALMAAFLTRQPSAIEFLLSRGACVDACDFRSQPVSKYAAASVGCLPSWQFGVENPSDLSVVDDDATSLFAATCITSLQRHGKYLFDWPCLIGHG